MKNTKRILMLLLALAILAFTACAGEEAKDDKSGDSSANSVNTPSADDSADASLDDENESGGAEGSEDSGKADPVPVSGTRGLTWVNPRYEGEAYYALSHYRFSPGENIADSMEDCYYILGPGEYHEGLLEDENAVYGVIVYAQAEDDNVLGMCQSVLQDMETAGAYVELYFSDSASADQYNKLSAVAHGISWKSSYTDEKLQSAKGRYFYLFATAKQIADFKELTAARNDSDYFCAFFPVKNPKAFEVWPGTEYYLNYEEMACMNAFDCLNASW